MALVGAAGWPLLAGRMYFQGDVLPQGLPFMATLQEALLQGELLTWNADLFSGYPMVAAAQSGSYYPLHWLAYGLLPLLAAYKVVALFQYWLLARGLIGTTRELGGSARAALVVAALGLLGGATAWHHVHFNIVAAMGWAGPILCCAARAGRREPGLSIHLLRLRPPGFAPPIRLLRRRCGSGGRSPGSVPASTAWEPRPARFAREPRRASASSVSAWLPRPVSRARRACG